MDPFSALGVVATVVQLTGSCLKLCREHIGPSKHPRKHIRSIHDDLWAFNGSLKNLQTHYDICEDSQARSITLASIEKPLSHCKEALDSIREHLESKNLLKRLITGAHFDTALEIHLSRLKNGRMLFHEVVQADHIVVLHAVEKYVQNSAKDIRDLQNTIGEIDERSRRDLERVHGSLDSIHNGQKDMLRSHEDSRLWEEAQARAQKDHTIIDWLSPLNFRAKQSDVLSSRSGSTGTWILETEEFKNWAMGSGKTLWCTGIPGAGKTVFTSIVVDHMSGILAGPRVAISCLYCSYKDEAIQTPTSLIASILQQILKRTMIVSDDLRALYKRHETYKTRPTLEELSEQLQASVCNLEKFFVVIDALDECPDVKREKFLEHMRKLQPAVNLMFTTRPASHVANGFPEAACVEIRAKDTDIQSYCEAKIRSDHRLHFVQDDADLKHVVINRIAENAQKMFLLAVLHIESLASQLNKAQVRNALEKLPKGLEDTYHEALQRIAHQGPPSLEMANKVLSWISYAYRPLTVEELRCALAVTPGQPTFDEDAKTLESTLVSVCAGLVTIDPKSTIIRLVHYTTQEFFEKIRDSRFPTAQADITLTCLTYLSFDHPAYLLRSDEYRVSSNKAPFLAYAAKYWPDHVRASPETNSKELILQILSQPRKFRFILDRMYGPNKLISDIQVTIPSAPPLWAAAFFGLESVVVLLLERGADLTETVTSDGKTALNAAAFSAQLEVIKILLDHGASLESRDSWGCTPLFDTISAFRLTNEKRAVAAARLLLDRGADIDVQIPGSTSTLMFAASSGLVQMVELLLTYGADAKPSDVDGYTALHLAHRGRPKISRLLVKHGADLNTRSNEGYSALHYASGYCDEGEVEDTVRMLLELGADIHSKSESGETALFRAASAGYCRTIQVLIEHGADIHARDKLGRSVLFSAIESYYRQPDRQPEEVVSLLLDHGADVNLQDSTGETVLARAAASALSGTVKVILDHKPHIDTRNGPGDTALTLAAAADTRVRLPESWVGKAAVLPVVADLKTAAVEKNLKVIKLLLSHGASIDLKNKAEETALTLAAAKGKLNVVRLLLEHGADINTSNGAGDTALTLAAAAEALKRLDYWDVNYNSGNAALKMPVVAVENNLSVIKLLLNHGASIDLKNKAGDTALTLAAAMERDLSVMKLLLSHGANIDLKNKAEDTALTLAAAKGKLTAVKLLLNHGANIQATNNAGDTALSLATRNDHSEVQKLLLKHLSESNQQPVYTEVE